MKSRWFLALGLILGLAGGLFYAWSINPVRYVDTYPPLMHRVYRADWIRMTALAYGATGNLERAELRLRDLSQEDIRTHLEDALEYAVASGRPLPVLQRMAGLAKRYGVDNPAVQIYGEELARLTPRPSPTAAVPSPSPTPTLTPVPLPSPTTTPSPTPELSATLTATLPTAYTVEEQEIRCLPQPQIAISISQEITVTVRGRDRLEVQGIPGVEVWLIWARGADRAITGLRPNVGEGYADFTVAPEETYNLYLTNPAGAPLITLRPEPCTGEERGWRSWLLQIRYDPEEEPVVETP
ncbi:MAG: hypothetical protein ACLFU8_04565 [Anaerolineales bacterium]